MIPGARWGQRRWSGQSAIISPHSWIAPPPRLIPQQTREGQVHEPSALDHGAHPRHHDKPHMHMRVGMVHTRNASAPRSSMAAAVTEVVSGDVGGTARLSRRRDYDQKKPTACMWAILIWA